MLLHVTLLPIPHLYSTEVMEQVLPTYVLENWKILREKATDTVIERGVLIPHPKEDYDLMEERLLESLDLKTPRILKCGHFHLDPEEEADVALSDDGTRDNEEDDTDICFDCGRRVRDGRYGSGTGSRRWDIKVYAANGLMRAGAWSAAWREMERVDVEITPWMDDELKRELVLRSEDERNHSALLREEVGRQRGQRLNMDEERMREIYGNDIPGLEDEQEDITFPGQPTRGVHQQRNEIPLQDLLKKYLLAAARDWKNIAIFFLSIFVLYFSIASMRTPTATPVAHQPSTLSRSLSIPSLTSISNTNNGVLPISEPSTTTRTEAPTISAAPKKATVEHLFPAEAQSSSEDSTDSIEARFEFIGEY